jgi:hypothetical protein
MHKSEPTWDSEHRGAIFKRGTRHTKSTSGVNMRAALEAVAHFLGKYGALEQAKGAFAPSSRPAHASSGSPRLVLVPLAVRQFR